MLSNSGNRDESDAVSDALDQGLLTGLLARQLRVTYLAVFRVVEQRLAELGITPQQFALLVIVDRNPGSRQSLLAKARGLDKSTLVPMIDRLERDGLVERKSLANDRRIRTIWMTDRGKRLLGEAIPSVRASDEVIRAQVSEGEAAELLRILDKIRAGLENEAQ